MITEPVRAVDSLYAPPQIEDELIGKAKAGRLGTEELIRRAEELSFWERLQLYYYAMALEPYFLGLEDIIRGIARTPPEKLAAVEEHVSRLSELMAERRASLMASGRREPEKDWQRGLAGLIFLDFDWRGRVAEQGKNEIKNPYDLLNLLDCLDAGLRGLDDCNIQQCMSRAFAPGHGADHE